MSEHTNIGWTDATHPIVAGCDYVSPGCSNCWAVRDSWRLAHNPSPKVAPLYRGTVRKSPEGKLVWTGVVRPLPERLAKPLTWRKARKIFWCSQSDLFHPKVPFEFIAAAFGVMAMAHWHTHQVLTKHPQRAAEFFEWIANDANGPAAGCLWHARQTCGMLAVGSHELHEPPAWPLENVWVGVTVEDQKRADERLPHLMKIPAVVHWVSYEPALELVDFGRWLTVAVQREHIVGTDWHGWSQRVDWIVFGGESAQTRANTRICNIQWARVTRDACKAASVAFFLKQFGSNAIIAGNDIVDFPLLLPAGRTARYKWHEPEFWPADLRIQEFPE